MCRRDEEETVWSGLELGNGNKISVDHASLSEADPRRSLDIFALPISPRNGFGHYAILN